MKISLNKKSNLFGCSPKALYGFFLLEGFVRAVEIAEKIPERFVPHVIDIGVALPWLIPPHIVVPPHIGVPPPVPPRPEGVLEPPKAAPCTVLGAASATGVVLHSLILVTQILGKISTH